MPKKILTAKEQRFVKAYASGELTGADAVLAAGYNSKSTQSASSLATKMLRKDYIQKALSDVISADFPDIASLSATAIYNIIASDETKPLEKIRAIEFLSRICGWDESRKKSTITIESSFALPEE